VRARSLASLLALALAVPLLSGCSGAGGSTAKDALPAASDSAHSWSSDAVLVSVGSTEITPAELANQTAEVEAQAKNETDEPFSPADTVALFHALVGDGDARPGDGRAPAWGYLFLSPKGIHVVVSDGGVQFAKDVPLPALPRELGSFPSIGDNWSVDSDQAAQIAMGNSTLYDAIVAHPGAQGSASLGDRDGTLAWSLFVSNETAYAHVTVDAATGEVLEVYPRTGPTPQPPSGGHRPPPPSQEGTDSGSASNTLLFPGDARQTTFNLHQDHASIRFALQARNAVGLVDVRADITDPNGNQSSVEVSNLGVVGSTTQRGTQSPAPQGDWQVTLTLVEGAAQQVEFDWCAGPPVGDSANNPACQSGQDAASSGTSLPALRALPWLRS